MEKLLNILFDIQIKINYIENLATLYCIYLAANIGLQGKGTVEAP